MNSFNESHKNISLNSIRSKNSEKNIRPRVTQSSLNTITNPILSKEENKVEKTVRLEEVDNYNFTVPKSITAARAKIIQENNKLRKLSTIDQKEELISSQKSVLEGIVNTNKDTINDFGKDKHTDPCATKVKKKKDGRRSNRSHDSNSSQAQYSVLGMHKRKSIVFLPIMSTNKSNNYSKLNLNQKTDSDISVLSKKNFDKFDIKHSIGDKNEKSSKPRKFSNFKPDPKEPK